MLSGIPPNLVYTPKANLSGSDSFSFRVRDGASESAVATVSILITAVNDEPVALAQSVLLTEDTNRKVVLRGTDAEGSALTFKLVDQPTKGVITGIGANLFYTPNANATGLDSFTFKVNDGALDSSAAIVSVNIVAVNDAPVAISQAVTTDEDKAIAITLLGSDVESSTLSYTLATVPSKGTLSGSAPNLTYTPYLNVSGSDSFTFKVNDGTVDSATVAKVSIIVTAVNDIPVALDQSVSTTKNTARRIVLSATDAENQPLTYSIVSGSTHGTLSGTGFIQIYTPESNYVGPDSFSYKASDASSDSVVVTVNIRVSASNVAPVALDQAVSSAEDTAKAVVLGAMDDDNDPLTYIIVSNPTRGTLLGTPPNITYIPNTNAFGVDTFTFKVNDGGEDSSVATVTVNLSPVNDVPVVESLTVSGSEDSTIAVPIRTVDPDGDQLSYTVLTQPAHGTLGGTPPLLNYTPEANYSGSDSFQFKVSDGFAESLIAIVTLTVDPVNDPPTLNAIEKTVLDSGKELSFKASGSDIDVPAQTLIYSLKFGPDGMTVSKQGEVYWLPKSSQRPSINTIVIQLSDGIASVDRSFVVEASEARQSTRFAGAAIDGYIAGATLWFDADLDGILDPEEPHTFTDREGNFDLDFDSTLFDRNNDGKLDPSEGRLVVEGGVDLSSGQPRVGQLTAPAGSQVITPLTTMVDLVSRQGAGMSTLAAEERVRTALGLPVGISVTSYDPVSAAIQGDSRAATVQAAASSVADSINLLASVINGASQLVGENESTAAVSQILASKLVSGNMVNLNSKETLNSALSLAAASTGVAISDEVKATASQVVAEQNTAKTDAVINAWNPLDALMTISQVQAVSQSGAVSAMGDLGAGKISPDEVVLSFTGLALAETVAAAPIGDVTGKNRSPGRFEFSVSSAVVSEGGRSIQPMTVTREGGAYGIARLQIRLEGDSDLLLTNVIDVEFADAVTQQTINLASVLRDDLDPQLDRTITAVLNLASGAPNGASLGAQVRNQIRVIDNDSAGSIGFALHQFKNTEGGEVSVELVRTDGTAGRIVAVVRLYGGTASPGHDYPVSVITTEFASGQTRKVVNLGWIDDGVIESAETVNAYLEIGSGSAPGSMVSIDFQEAILEVEDKFVPTFNNAKPVATGVAEGGALTVVEGQNINLTLQGSDPEGGAITYIRVGSPTKGGLSGKPPFLIYTASLGQQGEDSFSFKVNDGQSDSTVATIRIVVETANVAPVALAQVLTTEAATPLGLRLAGTDAEGDPMTYRVVNLPSQGILSGKSPDLTYTPRVGFIGADKLEFVANDGRKDSKPQIIWLVVSKPNFVPKALDQRLEFKEDTVSSIALSGLDPEGSP